MPSAQTKLGKLGIGTSDPVTSFLRFKSFDPGTRRELREFQGTAGTLYVDDTTVREVRRSVGPSITMEPTTNELALILAWAFATGTGSNPTVFNPQDTPPTRNVHWFPVAGDPLFLTNCACDTITFSAQVGDVLNVSMNLVGQSYDTTHSSFPSISADQSSQPFVLADLSAAGGAFSLGGTTLQPRGFSVQVSNNIDKDRYLNSLTLTRLQKLNFSCGVQFDVPSGDNPGLFEQGMSSVAFVAKFVNLNTSSSLQISCPAVSFPAQSPRPEEGGEGWVTIDGTARRHAGSGTPITVSLV